MDIRHGQYKYETAAEHDHKEGWAALNLVREAGGTKSIAARVIFWDAEGQFSLEMKVSELPLRIVQKLIDEARATIKTS